MSVRCRVRRTAAAVATTVVAGSWLLGSPVGAQDPPAADPAAPAAVGDDVVARVVASVGLVRSAGGNGSGWVAGDQTVVTNRHVAKAGTGDIYVDFSDGERVECYTVVADRAMDLAVLKCPTRDRQPIPLGGAAAPGTPVIAVGYPGSVGPRTTHGHITPERRNVRGIDTVGFTAAIEPGSSGSPVVDPNGAVLAVATFGGGYGVPVRHLASMLEVAEHYPVTKDGAEWRLRVRRSAVTVVVAPLVAWVVARRRGRSRRVRYVVGWTVTSVLAVLAATQVQFMMQGPAHFM